MKSGCVFIHHNKPMVMVLDHQVGGFAQAGLQVNRQRRVHHLCARSAASFTPFSTNGMRSIPLTTPSGLPLASTTSTERHAGQRHGAGGGDDRRVLPADQDGIGHDVRHRVARAVSCSAMLETKSEIEMKPTGLPFSVHQQAVDILLDQQMSSLFERHAASTEVDRKRHQIRRPSACAWLPGFRHRPKAIRRPSGQNRTGCPEGDRHGPRRAGHARGAAPSRTAT